MSSSQPKDSTKTLRQTLSSQSLPTVSLHTIIDDPTLLAAFHQFSHRYHAEESLIFWMSVEVFRHRTWKAAKFFGMEHDAGPVQPPPQQPSPTRRDSTRRSKSILSFAKRNVAGSGAPISPSSVASSQSASSERFFSKADDAKTSAAAIQRKLDEGSAQRMGVTLEQLYLVKEADFIYESFCQSEAPHWICIPQGILHQIEETLDHPKSLTREVFTQAQNHVWSGMNGDLFPRFMKEIREAGSSAPESQPLTPVYSELRQRLAELEKTSLRRKTGVSTALAFAFRAQVASRSDRRLSTEVAATSEAPVVTSPESNTKAAASLLRTQSSILMLSSDPTEITSMSLSKARLSGRRRSNLGLGIPPPRPSVTRGNFPGEIDETIAVSSPFPGERSSLKVDEVLDLNMGTSPKRLSNRLSARLAAQTGRARSMSERSSLSSQASLVLAEGLGNRPSNLSMPRTPPLSKPGTPSKNPPSRPSSAKIRLEEDLKYV